jgi:hypothetical protein
MGPWAQHPRPYPNHDQRLRRYSPSCSVTNFDFEGLQDLVLYAQDVDHSALGFTHDTAGQIGRRAGISDPVLDAICGHAPASVGSAYGRASLEDMAAALKIFPRHSTSAALRSQGSQGTQKRRKRCARALRADTARHEARAIGLLGERQSITHIRVFKRASQDLEKNIGICPPSSPTLSSRAGALF